MIHIFDSSPSVFNVYMKELRDSSIQKDAMRFRHNLERMGEIMAYEISKQLEYKSEKTITPLGEADCKVLKEQPVLATVLRAGLPLHNGMLRIFDQAENGFISAYRKHHKDNTFDIQLGYLASPSIENKILILADPMLASGASMEVTYKAIIRHGTPKHTHLVSVIASKEGIEHIKAHMPHSNYTLWVGAVDEELTAHAYIVPGLGDAGDLAFGEKL